MNLEVNNSFSKKTVFLILVSVVEWKIFGLPAAKIPAVIPKSIINLPDDHQEETYLAFENFMLMKKVFDNCQWLSVELSCSQTAYLEEQLEEKQLV